MCIKITSHSEEETKNIASKLAKYLDEGDLLLLSGDLGSGKTVFVKGIVSSLTGNNHDPVISPTFTLINEYRLLKKVYHIDLYRIDSIEELEDLGIDELINDQALTIIEWADKFLDFFISFPHISIQIEHSNSNSRNISISASESQKKLKIKNIKFLTQIPY
jgi:tRNA threonylcarbamoyladenosine biosynthesis protein TsaE